MLPNTKLFEGVVNLEPDGRIIAGEDCKTNLCRESMLPVMSDVKPIRQLTAAAADGTVAALLAEKYLESLKENNK